MQVSTNQLINIERKSEEFLKDYLNKIKIVDTRIVNLELMC